MVTVTCSYDNVRMLQQGNIRSLYLMVHIDPYRAYRAYSGASGVIRTRPGEDRYVDIKSL